MIYCREKRLLVNEYLGNRVRKFLPSLNPDTNTSLLAFPMINDNDTIQIKKCMNKIKHHSASKHSIDICNITDIGNDTDDESSNTFRFELDSHANMPVVGRGAYIIASTGETADVNAYDPQHGTMRIPVVDAAVQYNCPYTDKPYILVIKNALHVPSMDNHLMPPFIMREAGIIINDIPKMQILDPDISDHSIYFKEDNVRIPLSLNGIFSYFSTSMPTSQMLEECEDVYLLTPLKWDPHNIVYAHNEDQMLDWQGDLVESHHRQKIVLTDVHENVDIAAATYLGPVESNAISKLLDKQSLDNGTIEPPYPHVPPTANEIASVLSHINPTLDDTLLHHMLTDRNRLGQFQMSVGSTSTNKATCLFDVGGSAGINTDIPVNNQDGDLCTNTVDSQLMDKIFDEALINDYDLDDIMVSAVHVGKNKNIKANHLSKIWRIDEDTARKTIDITSQHCMRKSDPKLSRNYGTNDRMLRYKHLNEYFFMDTLFATKTAHKSSRGHTCMQLFVTDKGFVYVVPMKKESEVLPAIKQFAKAIGAPDAIICDASRAQTSQKVRQFLNDIGTTLRVLEENTPWANKAELYIGIIK